jgi:hypothetical protein
MIKGKMRPVETIPGMEGKENGGGAFNYDML